MSLDKIFVFDILYYMARNKQAEILATSFVTYVVSHPEERFWQALRNWAGVNFIYVSDQLLETHDSCGDVHKSEGVRDTFSFKGLDK